MKNMLVMIFDAKRSERIRPLRVDRIGKWNPTSCRALLAVFVTGAGLLSSCGPSAEDYNVPASAFEATPKSTMSVGDRVSFTFPGAPEYNQAQKIQPDGQVGLPMVGMVTAAGRTPSSLQSALTSAYGEHLNDPTVFVSVAEPAAAVYVSGEVRSPGKVPLSRPLSAFEAVMETGGFSTLANPQKVYIIRTENDVQKRYVLNLSDPISGVESQAFYLRPYDVVFVERSNW